MKGVRYGIEFPKNEVEKGFYLQGMAQVIVCCNPAAVMNRQINPQMALIPAEQWHSKIRRTRHGNEGDNLVDILIFCESITELTEENRQAATIANSRLINGTVKHELSDGYARVIFT